MSRERDEYFMAECLRLAAEGRGSVSPNPLVGAVLVRKGEIVSRGYHRFFGGPHAEVECLQHYTGDIRSTTLYVNLEPCSHHGKTPPCANMIIRSGIRRIVIAMKDPNPLVSGRSIQRMKKAGMSVMVGVLEESARELNRCFTKSIVNRMPYIHLKIAQTLDGMIGPRHSGSKWISGPESRMLVHRWRSEYDAVLVGAGTIVADNPRLTVRLAEGRHPDVVILDGKMRSPLHARIFQNIRDRRVILVVNQKYFRKKKRTVQMLSSKGVLVLPYKGVSGSFSLRNVLFDLYTLSIGSLFVEGGQYVSSQFLGLDLADELSIFVAPWIMGEGLAAFRRDLLKTHSVVCMRTVERFRARKVGKDILLQCRFEERS